MKRETLLLLLLLGIDAEAINRFDRYGRTSQNVTGFIISLTDGSPCNFDERWNPQNLGETLFLFLLLLLGIDIAVCLVLMNL
jgi:hypothetical protein